MKKYQKKIIFVIVILIIFVVNLMSSVKKGSSGIKKIYIGSKQVLKVYKSTNLIYTISSGVLYYQNGTAGSYSYTIPKSGTYKLEVWGAQGGNDTAAGGKGGYSSGTINLTVGTTLYIYVGGQGSSSSVTDWAIIYGGYNGGGGIRRYGTAGASGGGATDITLVYSDVFLDSYYRYARSSASYNGRIIVAGGGGGSQAVNGTSPGYGGGLEGGGTSGYSSGILRSRIVNVQAGGPGLQSNGGNAELFPSPDYDTYSSYSAAGSFGLGGTYYSAHQSNTHAGGGGGGWYGGGVNCHGSGGGGSGYIGGVSNGVTISGNASMPTYDGTSTMVGNSGNGYAKITYIG